MPLEGVYDLKVWERFCSKVNKHSGVFCAKQKTECWLWQAGCFEHGYGAFKVYGKQRGAHSVSWEFENGYIDRSLPPHERCVCHTCDHPLCVRAEHLYLGTNAENLADRDDKGRQSRGEGRPASKFKEQDIARIKERAAHGESHRQIALSLGVAGSTIDRIVKGASWAYLAEEEVVAPVVYKPGLVIASGGLDSIVLAYVLAQHGALRGMYFVDYGQASAEKQSSMINYHADVLQVPWYREYARWPLGLRYDKWINPTGEGKHIFTNIAQEGGPAPMSNPYAPLDMDSEEYKEYLKTVFDFVQGRNTVFLCYAAAMAISLGLDTIYTGFQFDTEEWARAPKGPGGNDTSPAFLGAFNALAEAGAFSRPVRGVAPFLDERWSKDWIVRVGTLLGVSLEKTYSCEFMPNCGNCRQCLIRRKALAREGLAE